MRISEAGYDRVGATFVDGHVPDLSGLARVFDEFVGLVADEARLHEHHVVAPVQDSTTNSLNLSHLLDYLPVDFDAKGLL